MGGVYGGAAGDAWPTMVAAWRDAAPEMEIHHADGAALPLPDSAFDLVVAFMSLQDVHDVPAAARETARVLVPGGHTCLAIVHPLNSAGEFAVPGVPDAPFVIDGTYLDESYFVD